MLTHHCQPNRRWTRVSLGLVLQNFVTGSLLFIFPKVKWLCHSQEMGPLKTCVSKVFVQWKTRPYIYISLHIHIQIWMINHNFMYYYSLYAVPQGMHCDTDPAFMVPVIVSGTPTFSSSRGMGQSGTFCPISGSQECGSSRLFPKTKGLVFFHSLQLFPVLNCPPVYCILPLDLSSFLLGQHILLSLIWTCLLCILHAQDLCPPLLQLSIPCTPVQGALTSSFKAVDNPVCACTHRREHIPDMYALIPMNTPALCTSLSQVIHRLTF